MRVRGCGLGGQCDARPVPRADVSWWRCSGPWQLNPQKFALHYRFGATDASSRIAFSVRAAVGRGQAQMRVR
jgi:hypothetical protein